jgi:hypothetical protein
MAEIYVVCQDPDMANIANYVHGVYTTAEQARLAAYHPYTSLTVLVVPLDEMPVDEAKELDRA